MQVSLTRCEAGNPAPPSRPAALSS
jgi:hypothetical protein